MHFRRFGQLLICAACLACLLVTLATLECSSTSREAPRELAVARYHQRHASTKFTRRTTRAYHSAAKHSAAKPGMGNGSR